MEGGADQNDSSDILETYTGGIFLRGWVGVWDGEGAGGPVISYPRHWIGLLCPVMSVQKTCDWMVYVFNVAGIGSITVNLGETTKTIRYNQRPHLCV